MATSARAAAGTESSNSTTCQVDVNVLPVNKKPNAQIPPIIHAIEDAPVLLPTFAKNLSKGSTNEYWQTLKYDFVPVTDIPAHDTFRLFDTRTCSVSSQCRDERCVNRSWLKEDLDVYVPNATEIHFAGYEVAYACNASMPNISPDGELTMQPARDQHGVALYIVTVQDDGGTAFGGENAFTVPLMLKVLPPCGLRHPSYSVVGKR